MSTRHAIVQALLMLGCAGNGATESIVEGPLAEGTWGGEDRGVIVGAATLHVHIGCTRGNFPGPVILDSRGRFRIDGSYTLRAFPVERESLPAQLSGVVEGRRLTFTIAVNDTVTAKPVALGPVSVTRGVEPRMAICPICERPGA